MKRGKGRPATPDRAAYLDLTASSLWLRGRTIAEIARELGITDSYVYKILAPHRDLVRQGGYARELEQLAAEGFGPPVFAKRGRPRKPPVD